MNNEHIVIFFILKTYMIYVPTLGKTNLKIQKKILEYLH